jgi:preprotein translocase subunit SecD
MQLNLRTFAPVLAMALLALAGCQTAPIATSQQAAPAVEPAAVASPVTAPTPPTTAQVEFFLAQSQPGDNLKSVDVPGGVLYLPSAPVLTRADLTEAAALVDRQGQNFVGLRFTESGARKLSDVSSRNVGKMLAVVIGRELVAVPRITEPLNRGQLAFGVPNAQSAASIAARIRGDGTQATTTRPVK